MTTMPSTISRLSAIVSMGVVMVSACATSSGPGRHENDVARVRLALAAEQVRHRDLAAALQLLDPLPKGKDERAAALTIRGTVFREKGLYEEAEADLSESIRLRDAAPAHAALAVVYDLRRDLERGVTHHAKAVELEPENAGYLNDLAVSLFARGKCREALPVYQRALRIAPDDRRIRNNYAFALARAGEFARASQQFSLGGTPAEAKNNLGYAYEQAGNLSQAFDQYLDAARLDPSLREAQANLRHAAEVLKRTIPPDVAGSGGKS